MAAGWRRKPDVWRDRSELAATDTQAVSDRRCPQPPRACALATTAWLRDRTGTHIVRSARLAAFTWNEGNIGGPVSTKMWCLPTARPTTGGPFCRRGPFDHCVNKPGGFCYDCAALATFSSAVGLKGTSGVGRKQLLMQATPRLRLGLSVRLLPGRPNMPELSSDHFGRRVDGGGRVRAGRVHPLTEWLSGSCRSAIAVDCGVEQRVAPCSSDEQVASHPALVFQASLLQHTS
jgi:hypothetical protein